MTYQAPVQEMLFLLQEICGLEELSHLPAFEEASPDMVAAILEEAGKFASEVLAPLNAVGDREGLGFADGVVSMPTGWQAAYDQLVEMGWNSPAATPEIGGMGLPVLVNTCIQEMFNAANCAFQLCPLLTQGAIEAIEGYASDALKQTYLPKLVSGEWSGTMNLTEPQAGSDLGALKSRAVPEGDHFLITGQKIFITHGEHDMTENIVHLVLARLPNAPAGVKGISLFVVPKRLVNADGSLGAQNDLRCVSIEHKLGIHASPTCTMSYGDDGGAIGYLVGEPGKGLAYMFAMMNNARLAMGIQATGLSERATQQALGYAEERVQGLPPGGNTGTIIGHPDVKRMLGLMRIKTDAGRIMALKAARSIDLARHAATQEARDFHQRRVDLLIPIVKGWCSENAVTTASLGMQVHGGMGYVEETGAAQHLRDARITTIYEGTTGIQALDLIGRKIVRDSGHAARELVDECRETLRQLQSDPETVAFAKELGAALDQLDHAIAWVLEAEEDARRALAFDILDLFGTVLGAMGLAETVLAAARRSRSDLETRKRLLGTYIAYVMPHGLNVAGIAGDALCTADGLRPQDLHLA
ncbi:MAG: acyl-CoA dehydrogenase [Donghicola eburneus]|nr:acyl-CoA dehydrogenase [Donghicola eburneus]MCI5042478.1 acyl-CoA dehydrogenase [Donghicola eburneus]MEE3071359.1 acyl-CoA dehydrogenase [Pseudomonadota bacterium]